MRKRTHIKTENDLQVQVVNLLRKHNFIPICTDLIGPVLRFIPTVEGRIRFTQWSKARGGAVGIPDLVVVHRTGTFFLELKTPTGRLSPEQKIWRDRLIAEGYEYHLWRTIEECQKYIIEKLNSNIDKKKIQNSSI